MLLSKPKDLKTLDISGRARHPETVSPTPDRMLAELKAWIAQKRGRHTEAARRLGISTGHLSDYFSGRSRPSWEVGRKIEALLKRERRKRRRPPDPPASAS